MGCYYSTTKIQSDIILDDMKSGRVSCRKSIKTIRENNTEKKDKFSNIIIIVNNEEIEENGIGVKHKLSDNIISNLPHKNFSLDQYYLNDNTKDIFNHSLINTTNNSKSSKRTINHKLFAEKILEEINKMRTNPTNYSFKLEKFIQYIIPNKSDIKLHHHSPFLFEIPNSEKITLPNGVEGFNKVIELMRSQQPLGLLKWNEEIKIEIDDKEDFNNEYIKKIIAEKRKILKLKFPNFSVNIDVITDPEISAVLQLVDDNPFQGNRRMALLNPKFSYFAVSHGKDKKKKFFSLISFA